ncbi:MAG: hypothetical protein ABIJ41_04935 [Candidatus Omnitrophota bacterium]
MNSDQPNRDPRTLLSIIVISLLFVCGILLALFEISFKNPLKGLPRPTPYALFPSPEKPKASGRSAPNKMYVPNPRFYPEFYNDDNPIHKAVVLHRTVHDCETREQIGLDQTIQLYNPDGSPAYMNYACRSRYQQQCYRDGSFDRYYDEWCEDENGFRIEMPDQQESAH